MRKIGMYRCLISFLTLMLVMSSSTTEAGLIAYYPFEGNADDASGNGNNGTILGATPTNNGFHGSALQFDGINDYVGIPININPNALPQLSMGAWINSNTTNPGPRPARMAISHDNGGFDRSLGFDTRGGGGTPPDWMIFTGTGVRASGVNVAPDQWVFLAVTYDQTNQQTAQLLCE